jgi:hypothetical protein
MSQASRVESGGIDDTPVIRENMITMACWQFEGAGLDGRGGAAPPLRYKVQSRRRKIGWISCWPERYEDLCSSTNALVLVSQA